MKEESVPLEFESAGKVGNQGVINISFNPDNVINAINNGITIDGKEIELQPAKDNNEANSLLCKINNTLMDSNIKLDGAYCICGCPILNDIELFGKDLEQFLTKYSQK